VQEFPHAKDHTHEGAGPEDSVDAIVAKVKADLAAENAEIQRRAEQSGFSQGQERWRALERQKAEQEALNKDHVRAQEKLDAAVKSGNADADELARLA
jgi:hypothetical protein